MEPTLTFGVTEAVIVALITSVGAIITAVSVVGLNRSKSAGVLTGAALELLREERDRFKAECIRYGEAVTEVTSLKKVVDELEDRVRILEIDLAQAKDENESLRGGVNVLTGQLEALDTTPEYIAPSNNRNLTRMQDVVE